MSPRSFMPSGKIFFDPPSKRHAIAFLISLLPYIEGAMQFANVS